MMRTLPIIALMLISVGVVSSQAPPQLPFPLRKGDVILATIEMQAGVRSTALTLRLATEKQAELTRVAAANRNKQLVFTVGARVLPPSPLKRPVAPGSIFVRLASPDDAFAIAKELLY